MVDRLHAAAARFMSDHAAEELARNVATALLGCAWERGEVFELVARMVTYRVQRLGLRLAPSADDDAMRECAAAITAAWEKKR